MHITKKFVAAVAVVLSLSACAVPDGIGGYGTKQVVGGLGGAAAGGLLGSQFGRGSGNLAMTGMGVLLGALAGGAAGQALDRADQHALERNTPAALNSSQPIVWSNPQNGHQVTVTPLREGWSEGSYCREFRQTITVGDRSRVGFGNACRQPDGSWKIVQGQG